MTFRACFNAKIAKGIVSQRAGRQLLEMLDAYDQQAGRQLNRADAEMFKSANAVSLQAMAEAFRKADNIRRTVRAQSDILRGVKAVEDKLAGLRAQGKAPVGLRDETRSGVYTALSSFLDLDVRELATWNNVSKLAEDLTGRAHAAFREAIGRMRPGKLGFADNKLLEIDFLRAAHGRTDVPAAAVADAKAWFEAERGLSDGYIEAGGQLAKREDYFPNPRIDDSKARALGEQNFKQLVRMVVDRDKVLDFNTGARMDDAKFERLLDEAWRDIDKGFRPGDEAPSGQARGRPMLANARDAPRLFQMRDAESWMHFAETVGESASPYEAAVSHIHSMAKDTALLRILGPNPAATFRFMQDVLSREPGRLAVRVADLTKGNLGEAVKKNRAIENRNAKEMKALEHLYAEVSGANRVPASSEMARRMADARALLIGAQLGSTLITAINDPGTALMTARFNGLPIMRYLREFVRSLTTPGSEELAAQTGMVMDTLAHVALQNDKIMGDTVRSGMAARLSGAVIRASGLRKWTEGVKAGYGLGMQAHLASERGKAFGELGQRLQASLSRYGIDAPMWDVIRSATPMEPRPGARFLSPMDVAALGGRAAQNASEKLAQYLNSGLNYALLAHPSARLRAMIVRDTRPGTIEGEVRASMAMYRSWTGGMIYLHGAQALARGWDGSRLGHAALTFATVTLLGMVSMQIKEMLAGRDMRPIDATPDGLHSWGAAVLQGGGLGLFGDIIAVDKTKYGNTWASAIAGPIASLAEDAGGRFILGNTEKWLKGQETHFAGDALYLAARYAPGTSLWYAKLAFQRAVVDQLAKMIDPKTPERFQHMEDQARQEKNQGYWWRPGQAPSRAPAFTAGR